MKEVERQDNDMDDVAWLNLFIQLTGGFSDVVTENRWEDSSNQENRFKIYARVFRKFKKEKKIFSKTFKMMQKLPTKLQKSTPENHHFEFNKKLNLVRGGILV